MLQYAAVFFVIALIAAVFGFTGIAVGAAEIALAIALGATGYYGYLAWLLVSPD